MIENKVLVTVNVPALEHKFDVYIPVNRKVYSVIEMMKQILFSISLGTFDVEKSYFLYNALDGSIYDMNKLVRDTDIRNGWVVILL